MRLRELLARLHDRVHRDRLDAELDEELRLHRQLLERDSADAHQSLGNITYYREEARAMWSLGLLDDLLQDARYAIRVLRRDLAFTLTVVATLALGVGANTAAFSIVNAVLLRPLPYRDPQRLVSIWIAPTGTPSDRDPTSLPDVRDWQQQRGTTFESIAGFAFNRYDLNGPEGEAQARAVQGTGELYETLGARPELGRMPRPDEERMPVLAISDRLWRARYAASPAVIGSSVDLNGTPYTIVGVMPPGFHFPTPDIDLWTTLHSIYTFQSGPGPNPWITSRSLRGYRAVGRLAPNVTPRQAEIVMNQIEHRLGAAYPGIDTGIDIHVESVAQEAVHGVQRGLWTVFAAAGLILLLACVNVAHLLLARLSSRGRELAVRRALGAHRSRVVRQLVTESLVLGACGGLAGVAAAFLAIRTLLRFAPPDIPQLEKVGIDATTLGFALGVSLLTGLLFGVGPALLGGARDVHGVLRAQGTGAAGAARTGRTRSLLTALETAFALLLLVGAGLMVRSFARLTASDLGIRPSDVTVAQLTMVGPRYQTDDARSRTLDAVLDDIRATPGVTAAGASTSMPPTRIQEIEPFELTGKPRATPGHERLAIYIPATRGYLEALGIALSRGRAFDARDDAAAPSVVIINQELAARYFSNVDPVGQALDVEGITRTIVGVAGNAVYDGVGAPVRATIYIPFAQSPFPGVWIAIRSTRDAASLASTVRDAIRRVDPQLPVHQPRAMEAMMAESVVRPRFHAWLLGTFGGLALLLASIGIYGVIAYGVAQRRPEIGIRLALGAPALSVVGLMLRAAMIPVVAGVVAGLVVALFAARLLSGLLYGISPTDVTSFVGAGIVLALAGLAASYIPARRASRVDPLIAMRAE